MNWWLPLRQRYTASADPLRTQRRIELVALLLGLLILLQLAWGFTRLTLMAAPGAIEPAADSVGVPAVLGLQLVAAQQRNEIISRPLFWAGRRPQEAVAALEEPDSQSDSAAELDSIKLVGVFGGADTAGIIALVKGKKRRILLGGELEGWTLESIEPRESILVRGARRETLSLQLGSAKAKPGADPVAKPAPVVVNRPPAPPQQKTAPAGAAGKSKEGAAAQPQAEPTLRLGPPAR